MADDFYVSNGLTNREMAMLAGRYRTKFDIGQSERVDILEILEFKVPDAFPGFHLVVVRDDDLNDYANTSFDPLCIIVRQSIYDSAAAGSPFSRMILTHELGHLIFHSNHKNRLPAAASIKGFYSENIRSLNGLESAEAQASLFARHFLVPVKLARQYRGNAKKLAELAGVSAKDALGAIALSKRQEMHDLTF